MRFQKVPYSRVAAIMLSSALLILLQGVCAAVAADLPAGVVQAVQGRAYIVGSADDGRQPLSRGDTVAAWKTVTTDEKSRLLLQWKRKILTSLGSLSTVFVSSKRTGEGDTADIQLIEGVLRVSTAVQPGGAPEPYSLTTPVAAMVPESLDEDVDFIAEVYTNPSVTVVTVLRGRVRVKNLSTQAAGERVVQSCHNVYVEDGKPISDVRTVSGDIVGSLVAETTIEGTAMAQVNVCGLQQVAQAQPPTGPPPSGYVYLEDRELMDLYPYDEVEILPPEHAGGPIVCVLPGIGRWYFPYAIYHRWGFGPDVIRVYVIQVLLQRSLYYDYYYWNSFNARQHEYYDVLYTAQLAGNRRLIAQTLQRLDYLRIRHNLLGRRIHRLQARMRSLDRRFPRNAPNRAILNTMYNSLDSAKNIHIANQFRHRIQNELQIQNRLAANSAQELIGLQQRVARARDPRQRLKLRRSLQQFRNTIHEGRLPLSEKQGNVKNLLKQIAKTEKPDRLDRLRKELDRNLGKPEVMRPVALINHSQVNELKQRVERINPAARRHVDKKLEDLQRTMRQHQEIQTTQEKIDKALSEAAAAKNEDRREHLLRQASELGKHTPKGTLKGPLQALQEQQRLQSQLLGAKRGKKEDRTLRRLRELTNKPAQTVPQPRGIVPPATGKKQERVPEQAQMRKRTQGQAYKKQEEAARKRQQELEQQQRARQAEGQRLRKQQREQLRRQKEQADHQAEMQRRQRELQRKQNEAQTKQKEEQLRRRRMQELRTQQEQARKRAEERAKSRGRQEATQRLQQQQQQRLQQQQQQRLQQQQQQRHQQQRLQQRKLQEQHRAQQQQRIQQRRSQQQQQRLKEQKLQQQKRRRQLQQQGHQKSLQQKRKRKPETSRPDRTPGAPVAR